MGGGVRGKLSACVTQVLPRVMMMSVSIPVSHVFPSGGHLVTPMPGATPTKPGSASLPFFGIDLALLDGAGNVSLWVDGVLLASSWEDCFLEWDWMIRSLVPSIYLSPLFPFTWVAFHHRSTGCIPKGESHVLYVRACVLGGVRVACVDRACTARVCASE
jgi:hypothetical protein